ncbi:MAG TPA: efflux RND transporter periplasmic adaptor subunit, partial [Gemmataceae bacterium]|nr:efflux RND transporter periplasmic adaptor subunit [Gemmataceae bacterium]
TKVTAPITGRVGRPLITAGNLVQADATLLTTIVSQGTIYVYFSVDERAYRRYQDLVQAGKLKASADRLVLMQRENEKGFPHRGSIDFIESKLNQGTGTVQARATFPDPQKVIKAGEFVQIRVPVGEPEKALLIPEDAVGFDQGQKYVYVVDDQNKVEYRKVTTGAVHRGLQAVEAGLRAREWIVVKGLQRVRDGETVQPEREATTK